MTKESDGLKFSDEFKAGETGDVLEPKDNKIEKRSWLPKAAKKLVASVAVYAALNGAVPTDVFEDGLKEAVAASPVATVVATNNELDTRSEVVSREQKRQAIFHIGRPVYISTNPAAGEMNVLKKSDVAPRIVDGRTLLVVRPVAEATGALVSWDEKTETASLVKDGKTVRIKKNSYTLEIEDSSGIRYVEMDVPAQIIDGRFVLPVRFIIEALGDTVIWDEETRSVYVGYTQEEVDSFKGAWRQENEPMDALKNPENMYEVFQYMAGGEFADFIAFSNVIINEETSSAKIVFSNEDSKRVDPLAHAVLDGTTYTLEDLGREYLKQSGVDKIVGELKEGDVVFVKDGEFYVFDEENLKEGNKSVVKYDKTGNKQIVVNETAGFYYFSKIVWSEKYGVCIFDGTRITGALNTNTGKFEDLQKPDFVGTLKQRTVKRLWEIYNAKLNNTINPAQMSYEDILEFERTGSDKNTKTFKLINIDEDYGFIALLGTDGKVGFQKPASIENLRLAVQRVNEIDPEIAKDWVRNGLDFFTTNLLTSTFFLDEATRTWSGTYQIYSFGGVIYSDEYSTSYAKVPIYFIFLLTEEAYGELYKRHSKLNNGAWSANIDGKMYIGGGDVEEGYKKGKTQIIIDKYFPPKFWEKWDGKKPLQEVYPNWDWKTQGKY